MSCVVQRDSGRKQIQSDGQSDGMMPGDKCTKYTAEWRCGTRKLADKGRK